MKVKGKEILEMWDKANEVVSSIHRLGEIGCVMRGAGYDVFTDGFSACHFCKKGTWLWFYANCYDSKWKLGRCVSLSSKDSAMRLDDVNPEEEYEVEERLTAAEKYERGMVEKGSEFLVEDTRKEIGRFSDFESADKFAQKMCKANIDRKWKDRDLRPYYNNSVVNNEQFAGEKGEIRHYQYYNYQGHRYWISVRAVRETD